MSKESEISLLSLTEENDRLKKELEHFKTLSFEYNEELIDEKRKSEYLYGEFLKYKDLEAKGQINKKYTLDTKPFFTKIAHLCGHVLYAFPFTPSQIYKIKKFVYSLTGSLFSGTNGYNNFVSEDGKGSPSILEKDNGLVIPADIPLTSVIIPVFNNIELTRQCLSSIYEKEWKVPFEVIIVDDCSSDDISSLCLEYKDIKYFKNDSNLGFIHTANRGAAEATGDYLLFLNNDTKVEHGWLDELSVCLYEHKNAGMIGSALIHMHNGKLQESGNVICKNGDIVPLGRGHDPNNNSYTYVRDVDYSSGASIIIRKAVFEEMNGFDIAYAPAYYEDSDLALRMQSKGYKNYVCPLSRVFHKEMASYTDCLDNRFEKNRELFFNRWSDYLNRNSIYCNKAEAKYRFKTSNETVLYIDAEYPMADRGSGGMDSIFFINYLIKRGYDVVFFGEYTPGIVSKYTAILLRMGVHCLYLPFESITDYVNKNGYNISYLFICRIYQARSFDALLKKCCPNAAYIFDTVDIHFVRETLEANLKKDNKLLELANETKVNELACVNSADATIVISKDEYNLLTKNYKLERIYHIPQAREIYGLNTQTIRDKAVFIGSAHPPNLDALKYFHDEVLPLLPPDFKLTIIGEALKKHIGANDVYKNLLNCPQYEFIGFVENLADVLDYARLTIAPLRYGAGTKGKVASSMSYGVPCVSSSFGTEGTGMINNKNILIAKDSQDFANKIVSLLEDDILWKRISDGGLQFLKDNYAPENVEHLMDNLFDDVKNRKENGSSNWQNSEILKRLS